MKTQIGIIGGGPSGLLLSQLLHVHGIESIVLERQSEEYVLGRIRAGLLESRAIDVLKRAGVADNLGINGIEHEGVKLVYQGEMCHVNFQESTGDCMTIYGQTELTRDLYEAHKSTGRQVIHGVENVQLNGLETRNPSIKFTQEGKQLFVECDFIVGCDGYHGVSRASIPADVRREYEVSFPFGWLGVLSDTVPVSEELIYAYHSRGFALCSMRSPTRSRYYIQVPLTDKVEDWSDDAFWAELKRRLPADVAADLQTGPSLEKSIAPLRSFVCEPMRWDSLFLVGDAAHIVPPTGAKGLNLAISDVHYLFEALDYFYKNQDTSMLDSYSEKALKRVWKSSRFSWSLTNLLHDFYEGDSAFSNKVREAEFDYLATSSSAQRSFAENYVGLPY